MMTSVEYRMFRVKGSSGGDIWSLHFCDENVRKYVQLFPSEGTYLGRHGKYIHYAINRHPLLQFQHRRQRRRGGWSMLASARRWRLLWRSLPMLRSTTTTCQTTPLPCLFKLLLWV